MTEPVRIGDATLYLGDCMEILPTLPKVDAVITDPPYGIGKAEWDEAFLMGWFDMAAPLTHWIAVMPGTWNLMRLPQERAGFSYKWTLSAHLTNGMTKGGFGWGNWIPCVVFQKPETKPQPEYVQDWCRRFAAWCAEKGIGKRDLDAICGTSDMGGWYLGLLAYRCQIPAPHQWAKIKAQLSTPEALEPLWVARESDYEPQTDCKAFAVGGDPKPDHPSPKPLNVMRWFVDAVNPKRSVLDPFMGSGTTGVACVQLGRSFIGIEREPKYFDIACKRIEQAYAQRPLFESAPARKPEQLEITP
jgi:predicted RNA methylase